MKNGRSFNSCKNAYRIAFKTFQIIYEMKFKTTSKYIQIRYNSEQDIFRNVD